MSEFSTMKFENWDRYSSKMIGAIDYKYMSREINKIRYQRDIICTPDVPISSSYSISPGHQSKYNPFIRYGDIPPLAIIHMGLSKLDPIRCYRSDIYALGDNIKG